MDVLITQKKMTDSEAFVKARGGGNLIGKAMYGGGKITMKQLYLQSLALWSAFSPARARWAATRRRSA